MIAYCDPQQEQQRKALEQQKALLENCRQGSLSTTHGRAVARALEAIRKELAAIER